MSVKPYSTVVSNTNAIYICMRHVARRVLSSLDEEKGFNLSKLSVGRTIVQQY